MEYIKSNEHQTWAEIIVDRPQKMNALTPQMCLDIADRAEEISRRNDVRCMVFRTVGPNFSAGFDLATELDDLAAKKQWMLNRSIQKAFERVRDLPVATICELKGMVVGLGLIFAASCDLRYATEDAVAYVPELDLGVPFSLGANALLARHIGLATVAELVLTCNRIPMSDPRMSGFLSNIVPGDRIAAYVDDVAKRIGGHAQSVVLSSVTTIREAARSLLPDPASDLFTMMYTGVEPEATEVRARYARRFRNK